MSMWWLVAVGLAGWVCIGLTYAVGFVVDHARSARRNVRVPPLDSTYTLADDISVPLIEVVLDAEARADPDYWKPKLPKGPRAVSGYYSGTTPAGQIVAPPAALRPSHRLPDQYRSSMMILGEGLRYERLHELLNSPAREPDDCR